MHSSTESLPELRGALVVLSEVSAEDCVGFVRFLAIPEVSRHTNPPPNSVEAVEAWIRLCQRTRSEGTRATFAIRSASTKAIVGVAQVIQPEDLTAPEWGWSLEPSVWGTGVFQEVTTLLRRFARDSFRAAELIARVSPANTRAEQALRKIDSRLVATGTENIWSTSTL